MGLSTTFTNEIRDKLVAQRHELLREFSGAVNEQQTLEGQSFPDVGDEAYATEEKRLLERLEEGERAKISQIDEALARLRTQDYGECIDCGDTIPEDRLRAYPTALRCIGCQSTHERERGQRG